MFLVEERLNQVVELACTGQMAMGLSDCSGIPKQGTPCMGPRAQTCQLFIIIALGVIGLKTGLCLE